jgi:broad specificity phosphatase PhoE
VELIIVRHGETEWTISGQYTGTTDLELTSNGRRQAASLRPLLDTVLDGRHPAVYSSPRQRARQTAALAFPDTEAVVEPLLAEYDYGAFEGLTTAQIGVLSPGWNIWDNGCPGGESTDQVGWRADDFLHRYVDASTQPVVVISHGHFSRILAARALRQSAATGRLFASATASVSVITDDHDQRCTSLWNVSADLINNIAARPNGELPEVREPNGVREPPERFEDRPSASFDARVAHGQRGDR